MVEDGTFRQDLYYRLRVVGIEVPPLRESREDIALLVNAFIEQFAQENNKPLEGITPAALDVLMENDWHGNVRELKNCIEGMVVMASHGGLLEITRYSPQYPPPGTPDDGGQFSGGHEHGRIGEACFAGNLKSGGYDRRRARADLADWLSTLYRKEKEYGLRRGT